MSEKVLPGGTVSFLFTDMEGSTRLLRRLGTSYVEVLEQHRHLLLKACAAHGGEAFGSEGDSIVMAFSRATDSVRAALQAQLKIAEHAWPEDGTVRVRIGLHSGEAQVVEGNYVGLALHRAQRICSAAHGGQILLSATTRELTTDALPADVTFLDLEYHRLKDLGKPERLFQLVHPSLRRDFPALRTLDVLPNNIPLQLTSFIGRERDVAEVVNLLSTKRLVSLTGPGGVGKTRLGLQVAAELLDQHADGAWMVDLSPISDPSWIPNAVAVSVGMRQGGPSASAGDDEGSGGETGAGRTIVEQLVDHLRVNETLLLFDNCEHLVSGVSDVAEALLRGCPKVRILATTRERLDVPGEVTWAVPTLSVPDLTETPPADTLNDYEAIRLFVERAAQQHPGFHLTSDNAAHVVQIVNRLEGLPLAIELAAARVRVLTPEQIAVRLDDRFRLLAGGAKSLPDRQQTLLGAIDWSYELLTDSERHLLTAVSVFAGGFTIEAAERVWEGEGMAPADVFELVTQLVDKSLLVHEARKGEPRYRLLDTIRQYGWEKVLGPDDLSSHQSRLPNRDGEDCVFRREGDFWTVQYSGEVFRLRHSKGAAYLRVLLSSPVREFHALDLISANESLPSAPRRATEAGLQHQATGDGGPILDAQARAAYKHRLAELEKDLEEAHAFNDPEREAMAQQESDALVLELKRAVGLGGRERQADSPSERARVSTTKALRLTMEKIRSNSAVLADHLDQTITTGTFCSYNPDPRVPIHWVE